jgi:hypothetical protein
VRRGDNWKGPSDLGFGDMGSETVLLDSDVGEGRRESCRNMRGKLRA